MDGIFGNLLNALAEIWKSIGIAQKVSIILIGMVTLLATGIIFYMGSRPDWQMLYSNLDRKTAARVYDIVKENGVQVKLTNSGRTIMVPSSKVYSLRLKVASEGVAVERTGVGLELFEKMKLGATDKEQQVAFQRAIQGELQRMINEMPGVLNSKVLLTMPKKKVFRKDKSHPTASVLLVVEGGRMVSNAQVNSIRHMVASAVSGMSPRDVTITDNSGKLLVRQLTDEELNNGDSSSQLDICIRTENMLKEKAEAILRPIVGFDNVVAMVSCEMDFNNIDRVVENYDSERAVPVQEKTVTENDSRIRPSNGGKSGIASNSPQELDLSQLGNNRPAATARADNVSEKQRKTVEKSFLVPKTVEKTSIKGARVKRLTVAVTVARDAEKGARSPAELKQLEELVTAAVGVENYFTPEQLKKNPIVTVQEMSFVPQAKPVPPAISIVDQVLFEIDKYSHSPLIRPVFGFLLLLVLYKVFRKYFSGTAVEGMEFSGMSDSSVYGEDLRRIESEEQTEKEKNDREMLLESLEQGNKATPETVADILERWLASDQG